MSSPVSLPYQELLDEIGLIVPPGVQAYLVGGAVRDAILGRPTNDLDFAVSQDAIGLGRRVADKLEGAFYPLDPERDTARVILFQADGSRQILDFAGLRGADIHSDLLGRDFTLNAMALDFHHPPKLMDPLDGVNDMRSGLIRACSDQVFVDDPLRILRGVRLASAFDLRIVPETIQMMLPAVDLLPGVSVERVRDELVRILDGPRQAKSLRVLDALGVLPDILPEMAELKDVEQSPPHISDVWSHTLDVISKLEHVLSVLSLHHDPEAAANWALGFISVQLGRYREQIFDHLNDSITTGRSQRSLLFLAALYHDAGKPETRVMDDDGRIRFFKHEVVGSKLAASRGHSLRLSNEEVKYLEKIVRNHMRPLSLTKVGNPPSRRSIYRFFRDTGQAGVDVCLLSLADTLATYGPTLPKELWAEQLSVVRSLLESWFERQEEAIAPPPIINGRDLMDHLGMPPGPQIGELLKAIREAQAMGQVTDRSIALEFAKSWLESKGDSYG